MIWFVHQKHLANVVKRSRVWIPPFVVQLLGEYVVEINRVIKENLKSLDASPYSQFLTSNPGFLALTRQRVVSYWDVYYRFIPKEEYSGFGVLRFFENLVDKKS